MRNTKKKKIENLKMSIFFFNVYIGLVKFILIWFSKGFELLIQIFKILILNVKCKFGRRIIFR